MKLEMRDKGRYMDGNTPRNVMVSVYPSGREWKVSGFGMVREPGLASWKYFSYPLAALRGIKTQRNHAIWLCLDFLAEGRTETVCLPGLSNVSEVERTLREYMADRDKPASEPLAVKETPAADGKPAPAESPAPEAAPPKPQKDSDPTRTPSYFVTEAVKEAIGLYRYPAYALYRDDESAAAVYQDSGGSLCFLGADGSYKKEDRRVIERRHIHYYGPAGQVDGSKEAAARIPVDLSWISHPEAYFLYWAEMGRRPRFTTGRPTPRLRRHFPIRGRIPIGLRQLLPGRREVSHRPALLPGLRRGKAYPGRSWSSGIPRPMGIPAERNSRRSPWKRLPGAKKPARWPTASTTPTPAAS